MKKKSLIFLTIIEIIIVIMVIGVSLLIVSRNKYGFTQFGDKTFITVDKKVKKNIKNTKIGDLVVVKSDNKFKKKDTIYYYHIIDEKYAVSSGKIKEIRNHVYFFEDGDGVEDDKAIGKESITISHVGHIIMFLETKTGFVVCVLIPIIVVFIIELLRFLFSFKSKKKIKSRKKTKKNKNDKDEE